MKLIKEWKKSWKFTSVQVALLTSILSTIYTTMPEFREVIEPTLYSVIVLVLNLLVIIFRNIQQQLVKEEAQE